MISILVFYALFLSCCCTFVLNKQYVAILLVLLASNQMMPQSHIIVYAILFITILQFFYAFFSVKQNKSFLLICLLPIAYGLAIFLIQPYKININYYLGYLAVLFMFAWVLLLKWDLKKIVEFLTAYGLFLILTGFFEKIVIGSTRVGISLSGATAYAVVLTIVWVIWVTNVFLSKIYSAKIIFIGTFLVFLSVIFSGTRMGLIGIFIGSILCALSAIFIKNKNIIKIAVYSVMIAVAILFLSVMIWRFLPSDLYIKKTFSYLIVGKLDESSIGRLLAWIVAIDVFEQNIFLGIGAGNFQTKYELFLKSLDIFYKNKKTLEHAHNIYLVALSEHGIIGFLTLGVFVFLCKLRLFLYFLKNRYSPEFYGLFSGFIIIAILGLFDAIPMYLPTACFAAWLLGTCASFDPKVQISKQEDKFNIKSVS